MKTHEIQNTQNLIDSRMKIGMGRLSGKIALVSGGSRGMGAAHARAIVANDGKVVIGDILEAEGTALARELGSSARFIRLDVTKAGDWKAAVTLAVSEFGGRAREQRRH